MLYNWKQSNFISNLKFNRHCQIESGKGLPINLKHTNTLEYSLTCSNHTRTNIYHMVGLGQEARSPRQWERHVFTKHYPVIWRKCHKIGRTYTYFCLIKLVLLTSILASTRHRCSNQSREERRPRIGHYA